MEKEDYEIIPHELLQDLRVDVEELKKKLMQPDAKAEELILEMESLKDSIHDLTTIFQKALDQMRDDDSSKIHDTILGKLNAVMQQNEALSKGIMMLSDKMDRHHRAAPIPHTASPRVQHTLGMPSNPMQGPRMAPPLDQPAMPTFPPPAFGQPLSASDFPPPPPSPDKKRFGLFK